MTVSKMENSKKSGMLPWIAIASLGIIMALLFWYADRGEKRMVEYESRIDSCLTVIKLQKIQMEAISNLYDVDFDKLKSEKADSAFILLDFYRDHLYHDSINGYWYVTEKNVEHDHLVEIHHRDTIKEIITISDTLKSIESTDTLN